MEEDGGTTVLDKDTLTDGAGTPWKSMYLVFEKELNSYASGGRLRRRHGRVYHC